MFRFFKLPRFGADFCQHGQPRTETLSVESSSLGSCLKVSASNEGSITEDTYCSMLLGTF